MYFIIMYIDPSCYFNNTVENNQQSEALVKWYHLCNTGMNMLEFHI